MSLNSLLILKSPSPFYSILTKFSCPINLSMLRICLLASLYVTYVMFHVPHLSLFPVNDVRSTAVIDVLAGTLLDEPVRGLLY